MDLAQALPLTTAQRRQLWRDTREVRTALEGCMEDVKDLKAWFPGAWPCGAGFWVLIAHGLMDDFSLSVDQPGTPCNLPAFLPRQGAERLA